MHMQIGIITYGSTKAIAAYKAENILNGMIGETNQPFDYGSVTGQTVSVKGDIGSKIISRCIKATIAEFIYNMKNVRKHLAMFTDKELASHERLGKGNESTGMARHWMFKAGAYKGSSIYLYDADGEGVRTREHLNNVLKQWDKPVDGRKVYVTPFDVHY